ncbi:MAG TPA: response regulator [Candidatus Acidoferrales bacterium]|nr:response regulator [Candidatus Acidoferrales bacterium]
MARLVVISQGLSAAVHELGEGWTTIGRGDGNSFQVIESSISGRHCEVRLQGAGLVVRDLLSTNGTFVAGRKISEALLKPGETLRLGDVELRFETGETQGLPGLAGGGKAAAGLPGGKTRPVAPLPSVHRHPAATTAEAGEAEKRCQVLFVDDSMAFLELFSSLCAEYSGQTWKIHKAASADAALALLRDTVVDLVLLDISMPMLDGLQLLGIINRRYPGLRIAVMTGNATEAKRADALANGAELFLEKPVTADGMRSVFNMLNDLLTWDREGFTGGLRHVNLQEVIQVECNGRHSSILEIRNPEMRGQIYIEAGAITHAAVGEITGESAFHRLLSLRGGAFQVKPFRPPPQRTINIAWEFLLMDAARASDEETVMLKQPAAPQPAPASTPAKDEIHQAVGEDVMVFPAGETKAKRNEGAGQ